MEDISLIYSVSLPGMEMSRKNHRSDEILEVSITREEDVHVDRKPIHTAKDRTLNAVESGPCSAENFPGCAGRGDLVRDFRNTAKRAPLTLKKGLGKGDEVFGGKNYSQSEEL